MKTSVCLPLLILLMACGETRIQSVDDEVLEKANADKASASVKLAESTLLGDWGLCTEGEDGGSVRYDYTFAAAGKARIVETVFVGGQCQGEDSTAKTLTGTWKLLPIADSSEYTLEISWGEGRKLNSEYSSSGMQATLPHLMKIQDEKDLKLLTLKEKDRFLTCDKVKPSSIDDSASVAENMLLAYAKGLIARKGSWQSRCEDSRMRVLTFTNGQTPKITITESIYEDADCKKLKENASKVTSDFVIESVVNVSTKILSVKLGKESRILQLGFSNVDRLDLSDDADSEKDLTSYAFQGATP